MPETSIDERIKGRLLVGRKDAAWTLDVSLRTLDTLVAEKLLKARRVGKRVLFTPTELRRFAEGK